MPSNKLVTQIAIHLAQVALAQNAHLDFILMKLKFV